MSITDDVLTELRRIIRATQLNAKKLAREAGLTTSQLALLQHVANRGECSPRQLAQIMGLSQATISTLLDRVESRGLLERRKAEGDRRQVRVAVTPAGRRQLSVAPESLHARFLQDFAQLESWEQTQILASLRRVTHLLQADTLDASPVLDVGALGRAASPEPES
jgi:DNA-binding MarR family transcriptional regulator